MNKQRLLKIAVAAAVCAVLAGDAGETMARSLTADEMHAIELGKALTEELAAGGKNVSAILDQIRAVYKRINQANLLTNPPAQKADPEMIKTLIEEARPERQQEALQRQQESVKGLGEPMVTLKNGTKIPLRQADGSKR